MADSFLYFGYGCALNQTLVEFRVNQPVEVMCKGELKNYTLKFNRRNPDGTARANLSPANDDYTLGVVYKISKDKFEQMGQTEPEYLLTPFDIITDKGTISAFAFICKNCDDAVIPTKKHVYSIADYANLLEFPKNYVDKILALLPKS